uniref:Uncharacterized protein n=1 Tax=Rhizophora mucronata TaxID=61149 RepID=A0A2P2PUB3_RHIMU
MHNPGQVTRGLNFNEMEGMLPESSTTISNGTFVGNETNPQQFCPFFSQTYPGTPEFLSHLSFGDCNGQQYSLDDALYFHWQKESQVLSYSQGPW